VYVNSKKKSLSGEITFINPSSNDVRGHRKIEKVQYGAGTKGG
jgi:hypothetical protein